MKDKETYNAGNLPKIFSLMVKFHKECPNVFESEEELRNAAKQLWKSLDDKAHCPNCKASMKSYEFMLDMPNVGMLVEMGRLVSRRIEKGIPFTEANKIHVQTMQGVTYAMQSRTTQMNKLGLIAKVLNPDGTQVSGTWAITKRGYAALRGEEVPAMVESFRNEIIDRPEEKTTIQEVMAAYIADRQDKLRRGKKVEEEDYSRFECGVNEFVHFGKDMEGQLI